MSNEQQEELETYKCAVESGQLERHRRSEVEKAMHVDCIEIDAGSSLADGANETDSAKRVIAMVEQASWSQREQCQHLNLIAVIHIADNELAEARDLLDRALLIADEWLEQHEPATMVILRNLARVEFKLGAKHRSRSIAERLLACQQAIFGGVHVEVAETLELLATINQCSRNFGWSEMQYKKALWVRENLHGTEHQEIARLVRKLASLHSDKHDHTRAKTLLTRVLAIRKAIGSVQDEELGSVFQQLAYVHYGEGNYGKSENYYKRALRLRKKFSGKYSLDVADTHSALGKVYCATKQFSKAESSLKLALQSQMALLGQYDKETGATLSKLSGVYRAQGRFDKANLLSEQAMAYKIGPSDDDS